MAAVPDLTDCYPLELRFIKSLFLQGQYRRCIQTCRDILLVLGDAVDDNLLRGTFIHFYLALSHDEMARTMHHNSIARLPALHSAEQAYIEALARLPTAEDTRIWCWQNAGTCQPDHLVSEEDDESSLVRSPTLTDRYYAESSEFGSPLPLSPTRFHMRSLSSEISLGSPRIQPIALDEGLERADSVSEFKTSINCSTRDSVVLARPNGVTKTASLPREASSISLLDPPEQRRSFHLLRQIQPGPSRAGQMPQPQDSVRPLQFGMAQVTPRGRSSHIRNKSSTSRSLIPQPVSPMSISAHARQWSNASAVSSISTSTIGTAISTDLPVRHDSAFATSHFSERDLRRQRQLLRLFDQIDGLREQLANHLVSVQEVRSRTRAQSTRLPSTAGMPQGRIMANPGAFSNPVQGTVKMSAQRVSGSIQQARSYWSFVPENVKETEKRRRIESGRERKWEKKRFDPTRYRRLCERALAEL